MERAHDAPWTFALRRQWRSFARLDYCFKDSKVILVLSSHPKPLLFTLNKENGFYFRK